MDFYSKTVNQLIEELSRLPGIGVKSAQRLAFHIINMPKEQVEQLAQSMVNAQQQYPLLQGMLYTDRSGAMSDLWQCKERQVSDYGGGNFQRSGSL